MQNENPIIKRGELYYQVTEKGWSASTEDRVLRVILDRFKTEDPDEPKERLAEKLLVMVDAAHSEQDMLDMLDEAGM